MGPAQPTWREICPLLREHTVEHGWRSGIIYFIGSGRGKQLRVKIGWTSQDPRKRLADLQVGNPNRLELLGCLPGSREREAALHGQYGYVCVGGEWFRPDPHLLEEIAWAFEQPRLYAPSDDPQWVVPVENCEWCGVWRAADELLEQSLQ